MGYGFALLPTSVEPTSKMSFRLTPSEKVERDLWIMGALKYGLSVSQIAFEVGLSEQRVKQIIKENSKEETVSVKKKFKTPRDAAMAEFYKEGLCKPCSKSGFASCNDCFGRMNLIETEYDAEGWPYDWAMYGQEVYIEQCASAS